MVVLYRSMCNWVDLGDAMRPGSASSIVQVCLSPLRARSISLGSCPTNWIWMNSMLWWMPAHWRNLIRPQVEDLIPPRTQPGWAIRAPERSLSCSAPPCNIVRHAQWQPICKCVLFRFGVEWNVFFYREVVLTSIEHLIW